MYVQFRYGPHIFFQHIFGKASRSKDADLFNVKEQEKNQRWTDKKTPKPNRRNLSKECR